MDANAYNNEVSILKFLARSNNLHIDVERIINKKATKMFLNCTTTLPRQSNEIKNCLTSLLWEIHQ